MYNIYYINIKYYIYTLFIIYIYYIYINISGVNRKNNLGVGNVNAPATRYVLGHCTLYRLLTFRRNSILTCFFVFDYNISYYDKELKKKELFVFVLLIFFITLINLGAQIRFSILALIPLHTYIYIYIYTYIYIYYVYGTWCLH